MIEPALARDSLPICRMSTNGNLGYSCIKCENMPDMGHLRMLTHLVVIHDMDIHRAANYLSNAAYYAGRDVVETDWKAFAKTLRGELTPEDAGIDDA